MCVGEGRKGPHFLMRNEKLKKAAYYKSVNYPKLTSSLSKFLKVMLLVKKNFVAFQTLTRVR